MDEIKRYDFNGCCGQEACYCSQEDRYSEYKFGEWVKFTDFEKALHTVRKEQAEKAAKYHDERAEHFQACINKSRKDFESDFKGHHQQHIWEFQAMRDEHIQSAATIRAQFNDKGGVR